MTRYLLALALCAGTALPAFAEGAEAMSCADFMALDDAGRTAAMAPAEGGMMAAGDAGGMMAGGDAGGMMAGGDAGGMMAAGDAGGMMAAGDAGGMMAGGMMAEVDGAQAAAACAAHPDMTVGAALAATE